jgi:hypothetical protein
VEGSTDETADIKVPCHSRCGTIKITPSSNDTNTEHKPKCCSPLYAMATCSYE